MILLRSPGEEMGGANGSLNGLLPQLPFSHGVVRHFCLTKMEFLIVFSLFLGRFRSNLNPEDQLQPDLPRG
jgi:hypothetical protein